MEKEVLIIDLLILDRTNQGEKRARRYHLAKRVEDPERTSYYSLEGKVNLGLGATFLARERWSARDYQTQDKKIPLNATLLETYFGSEHNINKEQIILN